eukprot:8070069-Alexandrium_andersonii.AAC.1
MLCVQPLGGLPEQRVLYTPADIWPDLPRNRAGCVDCEKVHACIDGRLDMDTGALMQAVRQGDVD